MYVRRGKLITEFGGSILRVCKILTCTCMQVYRGKISKTWPHKSRPSISLANISTNRQIHLTIFLQRV